MESDVVCFLGSLTLSIFLGCTVSRVRSNSFCLWKPLASLTSRSVPGFANRMRVRGAEWEWRAKGGAGILSGAEAPFVGSWKL